MCYTEDMDKRWTTSNTAVYNIGYHFIWCPKYRRKVLTDSIATRLHELLHEQAKQLGATIEALEVMPDHVHIFIKCQPVDAPQWIIGQLKGHTSRVLRREFASLRSRLPCLWTRSYYCESVGHISSQTVKQYIKEQKNR